MSANSAYEALVLCVKSIVPSLFPFMVISSVLISSGFADFAGRFLHVPCKLLFNLSGSCAASIIIGALSGFPSGAKCASLLYEKGSCSKNEAERLLAICNNAGPAFIIAGVGGTMFGDISVGVLLYIIQLVSAVISGIAISFPRRKVNFGSIEPAEPVKLNISVITQAVASSSMSMLTVCGFVCFFAVFMNIPLCMIGNNTLKTLVCGFTELTNGVKLVSELPNGIIYAALFCGWSGLSVHMQVASFTVASQLSMKYYFYGKIIQSLLCAALMSAFIL